MKKILAGLLCSGCIHSTNPHPELFVHQEYMGKTDPSYVPSQTLTWEQEPLKRVPDDIVGLILIQAVPDVEIGATVAPETTTAPVAPTENPTVELGPEMAEADPYPY